MLLPGLYLRLWRGKELRKTRVERLSVEREGKMERESRR